MRFSKIFIVAAVLVSGFQTAFAGQSSTAHINIDFPSGGNGPFMGLATFAGWAADTASSISNVTASIDGHAFSGLIYGGPRLDVCTAYPGATCNGGWSLAVDTTMLTSGSHTFAVMASSAAGALASETVSFKVANWTAAGAANPIQINIDTPNQQLNQFSGKVNFAGWAIDGGSTIAGVTIAIDGISHGAAQYGKARKDVCASIGHAQGCPNIGWTFPFDSGLLADGKHSLAVTAAANNGQSYTVTFPFQSSNAAGSALHLHADAPNGQSGSFSGTAIFSGWAVDHHSTVSRLDVLVDGREAGTATLGQSRSDVCSAFPGAMGCPGVGWVFPLDTTTQSDGMHMLQLSAQGGNGDEATIAVPFVVNNSSTQSEVQASVDNPADGATLTGTYRFGGSASDASSAITAVQAYIDGNSIPVTYGISDPQACVNQMAVAPGCPNVGWSAVVDTNQLADGQHQLSILASAADGSHAATGKTFSVANWTTANPMRVTIDRPTATNKPLAGTATLSGWAIDDSSAVTSPQILVDGAVMGMAVYGDGRADVCKVYPGRAGCPFVGWHWALDTTVLSNGSHTLSIFGAAANGDRATAEVRFVVANPTLVNIDNAQNGTFSGIAGFGGWALNQTQAISRVSVLVDGIPSADATYGLARPDVCRVYPKRPGCPQVGWSASVDTTLLSNGPHTLQIIAVTAKGQQGSAASTFLVEQANNPALMSQAAAGRILDEATWGPTAASFAELRSEGFDPWFAAQVSAPVSTFADQPQFNASGGSNGDLSAVRLQFFQNAIGGTDQLRQRLAFALSEIWVVSSVEVSNASAFPPLLRIFQNRALDNYENLMLDVATSPAMGEFLNMVNNVKGNPAQGTAANENFARELMQLMSIGLEALNPDGTPQLDATGIAIPTYTQSDVTNLARALTGWTFAAAPGAAPKAINPAYYLASMTPTESNHDSSQKVFLGNILPAGNSAEQDLQEAIHIIFLQPSMGPFICRQLIQHLVTSNPSPGYIARVSSVFSNNGQGVRGDLKAVAYAILTDPEARAGDSGSGLQSNFGHLREPVVYAASLARGLSATLAANSGIAGVPANLGENLFGASSVFSYFSPFYELSNGLYAPEFSLYTTQNAANYASETYSAIFYGHWDSGTVFNLAAFTGIQSPSAVIQVLNADFLHGSMSSGLQAAAYQAMAPLTNPADRAKAALFTVLTSSEYLVMH